MTKAMLASLTNYNLWANKKIIESINQLPEGIIDSEIKNSFPSLRKTIYHIWDAQVIWLKRLQGLSLQTWPSAEYETDFAGFDIYFIQQCEEFDQFINSKPEEYFSTNIRYTTMNGKEFQNNAWQIIVHCMNHGTYHRGQIITMLRTISIPELPNTDYIFYLRERQ